MSVASVVLASLGLILTFIPNLRFVGMPLAIFSTVLGLVALRAKRRAGQPRKLAGIGFAIGLVATAVGVVFVAVLDSAERRVAEIANDPALREKMKKADTDFQNAFNQAIQETGSPDGGKTQ